MALNARQIINVGKAKTVSRTAVVANSAHRTLGASLAAIMLVANTHPVRAFEGPQGSDSNAYEQEMMSLIKNRNKKAVLEVKATEVAAPVVLEAPALRVEAAMTSEERSEAIRATAIMQATKEATAIRQSKVAGVSSSPSASSNGGVNALVGLAVLAAAVGGAVVYNNNNTGALGGDAASSASAPEAPAAAVATPEREQTPAPSA